MRFSDGERPSNLLFLSIDTLRKDHLGPYGSDLTPFLDGLGEEALVLDDHVQCSNWTFASTTCTLAGRSTTMIGHLPRMNALPGRGAVPEGTGFLAEWLGEAGLYSILSCGNDFFSSSRGNTQGYDEEVRIRGTMDAVAQEGIARLVAARDRGDVDEGWFLHLHFMEPHAPYNAGDSWVEGIDDLEPWPTDLREISNQYSARSDWPELPPEEQALLEAHLRALYAGEIRRMDHRLERVWTQLRRLGVLDDTLVVIWNDHGEQFWEHGEQSHAYGLHREETDGIAMFWADNIVPGRFAGTTSAVDLVPTLLDLWQVPIPDEVTGYPIGQAPEGRPIFADALARAGGQQSVIVDKLKLHYAWSGEVEMYDRSVDPEEQHDLYDPDDPRVLMLWSHLKPMVERMAELPFDDNTPTLPDDLP